MIEEGCSADIIANHINKNLKANIALGGVDSEKTNIKFNHIEQSKQEGIFVVEGGDTLLIESNIIMGNQDGIVMLHSNGVVISNKIQDNETDGISLVSNTFARIEGNLIENNKLHGIEIKDPSHPVLINNKIQGNTYQVGLDKKIRN